MQSMHISVQRAVLVKVKCVFSHDLNHSGRFKKIKSREQVLNTR